MRCAALVLLGALVIAGCRQVSGLDEALPSEAKPSNAPKPKVHLSTYEDLTCVQKLNGEVWCWGCVQDTSRDFFWSSNVPHRIEEMPPAQHTCVGQAHVCSVVEGGQIWCWGNNLGGQLGRMTSLDDDLNDTTPGKVEGFEGLVFSEVHCGWGHSCALTVDGAVHCWGANVAHKGVPPGQSGVDPAEATIVAPNKTPVITGVRTLVTMKNHNCVVRSDDASLRCWGSNVHGERAADPSSLLATHEPLRVELPDGALIGSVGLGFESTYAVTLDKEIFAWGNNHLNQLGLGPTGPEETHVPARVQFSADGSSPIALEGAEVYRTNSSHMCARVTDRDMAGHPFVCWGADDYGELGTGEPPQSTSAAVPAYAIPENAEQLVLGGDHGCALVRHGDGEDDWDVWCWGRHDAVGDGTATECLRETGVAPEARLEASPVLWE